MLKLHYICVTPLICSAKLYLKQGNFSLCFLRQLTEVTTHLLIKPVKLKSYLHELCHDQYQNLHRKQSQMKDVWNLKAMREVGKIWLLIKDFFRNLGWICYWNHHLPCYWPTCLEPGPTNHNCISKVCPKVLSPHFFTSMTCLIIGFNSNLCPMPSDDLVCLSKVCCQEFKCILPHLIFCKKW